jgi:uncharacterized membrane protein|uniref:DUF2273 domain-containing protein n=1 Tax=Dictyoglomus turgidum TaxID=513050 RepID=A0A7C3SQV3_9BACT
MNLERIKNYKYRLIFSLIFLMLGILILTIGFWRTLFLIIMFLIGYIIGNIIDKNLLFLFIEKIKEIFMIGR